MRTAVVRCAVIIVLLSSGAIPVGAQAVEVKGRVTDAAGQPISDVSVRLGEGTALSDSEGRFRLGGVPSGAQRLEVRRMGYRTLETTQQIETGARPLLLTLEQSAVELDAVVVTATRRAQRLADAPVAVEVVSRDAIERAGAAEISRIIAERTGVQLEGGHPAGEGVMIQGLGSERVLILLDGQPIVGRISGQVDLSRIPASIVERVEVIKGPQSSLYGSEAIGGVVNIITRGAIDRPWGVGVAATGGDQGRADGSVTLSGSNGPLALRLDGGYRMRNLAPGVAARGGAQTVRQDGAAKFAWAPGEEVLLRASGTLLDEEQRWKTGQLYTFANNRERTARLDAGVGALQSSLYWTRFDHVSGRSTSVDGMRSGDGEFQSRLEWEGSWAQATGPLAWQAGVEVQRSATRSDRIVGEHRTQRVLEPYLRGTLQIDQFSLSPGARISWSDEWGSHFTPSLAVMLQAGNDVTLRTSVGRGFRSPAFKELYMEFLNVGSGYAYTVRGNPDLRPESSTSISAGVEWRPGALFVRGQSFLNRFEDFIETRLEGDSTGVTVYTYGNITDGSTRGVELEGGWVHGRIRLEGGYAWLRAAGAEGPLLGRAAHTARGALDLRLPAGIDLALTATYTGETPVERADDEIVSRRPFARFDVRAGHDLPIGARASFGIRNLLDAMPDRWPGYEGRHIYAGVDWSIQARR